MIDKRRIAESALSWAGVCQIALLASLVLFTSCSDDGVGPELRPLTSVLAISYLDWSVGNLKYVEKTGEYWGNPEVVTYRGNVGLYSSLALDAQGVPHIAYRDQTNLDLMYATRTQDGWQRSTVDYNGNVGSQCALALDAQGIPYISYFDATNARVKCAWKADGAWITETVSADPPYIAELPCRVEYGFTTSIAVDADGNPHISYYTVNGQLGYAVRNSNGGWLYEIADSDGNVGSQCSLVLDAQGNPHICYLFYPSFHLKYASKTSGIWQSEVINVGDPAHNCAYHTDLALDAQGNPHICFQTSGSALGYLVKTGGSGWSFEIVDESSENIGLYSSLVVDAQGTPHISYQDYPNYTLKYAVRTGNGWATAVVDDQGIVGWYSSMAIRYR